MALNRILAVDDSAAMRETLGILLGGDYEIRVATFEEYCARTGGERDPWSLVILGASEAFPAALEPVSSETPVLWLVDRPEVGPRWGLDSETVLPRRFSPFELRRRVEELLSRPRRPPTPDRARSRIEPPFLSPETARLAQQMSTHDLPLFVYGEPGVGTRGVASALHAVRGGGPFLAVRAPTFHTHPLGVEPARHATLFLDRVDQLGDEGQQRLLDLLQPNGILLAASGARLRLVAAAENDLSVALERGDLSRELYHRLTVLVMRLPPLRERPQDIPHLAEALIREVSPSLGLANAKLTPGALARLSRYLWFGNLAELEAVLTRTLSIARKSVIEANDLLFDSMPVRVSDTAAAPSATVPGTETLTVQALDMIANELAHELKNPMATIKTFAQHLGRVLRNGGDEKEAARLTGEAVDRMDHVVENLLQFTRFGSPDAQRVSLASVVASALEDCERRFGAPPGSVEREPAPAPAVVVDLAQVSYALANLLRTLTRGFGPSEGIRIGHPEPGSIVLTARGREVSSRLSRMLPAAEDGEAALPLGVALATALVERNGGSLRYEPHQPTTVTVRLPVAQPEEVKVPRHGATTRSSR